MFFFIETPSFLVLAISGGIRVRVSASLLTQLRTMTGLFSVIYTNDLLLLQRSFLSGQLQDFLHILSTDMSLALFNDSMVLSINMV